MSLPARTLEALLPAITGPLRDNQRIGTMVACVGRLVNAADTVLSHQLGRTPNGYITLRSAAGGVLYDASDGVASWTAEQVKMRATLTGTYTFLLW